MKLLGGYDMMHYEGCLNEKSGYPCDLTKPMEGLCWSCRRQISKQPEHLRLVKPKTPEELRADYFVQLKESLRATST